MSGAPRGDLVLALYPFSRGVAFTLFEGPLSLVNWGMKDIRGRRRTARSLEAAKDFIDRFQPDVVVLSSCSDPHTRQAERVQRLQRLISNHAVGKVIEVHRYTRPEIRACFRAVGAVTRYEIAQAIASQVHALGHRLPPAKKLWESEDGRMALFDAAALVMTFYNRGGANSPSMMRA